MAIKSIEELRDDALDTLEKLKNGKLDVHEAGVTGKLYETVISSIKTQLLYAEMIGVEPKIAFMGDMKKEKVINMRSSTTALAHSAEKNKKNR